jgi:methyl-accepting chemotaxis protein
MNHSIMSGISIKTRLFLIGVIALMSMVLIGFLALQSEKSTLLEDRKIKTRHLVEVAHSQLAHFYALQQAGVLTEEAAKDAAIKAIKVSRYDQKEYFWLNDFTMPIPKMIMHTTVPALDGKILDAAKFNCATSMQNGTDGIIEKTDGKKNLFVAFNEVANHSGHGYVTYDWPKPKVGAAATDELYAKISYVKKFDGWNWLVGSGIYIDDVDEIFWSHSIWLMSIILGVVALMGFVMVIIIRSITLPLGIMQSMILEVERTGDYAKKINYQSSDEVGRTATAFNSMMSSLQRALSEANLVVGAIADADFNQRITGDYVGDLDLLKQGVNASAQSVYFMMSELELVMLGLNQGKFDVYMDDRVPQTFRELVEVALKHIAAVIIDTNAIMAKMNEGDFNARITADASGDLLTMKNMVNGSMDRLSMAVTGITHIITAQAAGDLTKSCTADFKGQLKSLQTAINESSASVKDVIIQAIDVSNIVNDAAAQVSQGSADLSVRVQEQASSLEQTSATMNRMTAAVQANTANAHKVATLTNEVQNQAKDGVQVMQQTITAMQSIKASSSKINDIVTIIDGIAFQTNLLALNAAVEAARAGEHGRGFAVVAGEVRALAGKSADAAKDIKGLIEDSVSRIDNGTRLADKSGEMLNGIASSIAQVSGMIEQIASASNEQAKGINQVHQAIAGIDRVTQENAALVEETTAAASSLSHEADNLRGNMAFFKTGQ